MHSHPLGVGVGGGGSVVAAGGGPVTQDPLPPSTPSARYLEAAEEHVQVCCPGMLDEQFRGLGFGAVGFRLFKGRMFRISFVQDWNWLGKYLNRIQVLSLQRGSPIPNIVLQYPHAWFVAVYLASVEKYNGNMPGWNNSQKLYLVGHKVFWGK